MTLTAGKLAPSAIVLACVGYCAWPSLTDMVSGPPPQKAPRKLPELAATLFSPKLPMPPRKNPWGGKDVDALAAAKEAAKAAELAKGTGENTGKPGNSTAASAAEPPGDPLSGLKLDATLILGGKRMAVINGRLYAPQQRLPAGSASGPPFTIAKVLPYGVLLERGGKTIGLGYANAPARAVSTSPDVVHDDLDDAAEVPRPNAALTAATGAHSEGNGQLEKAGK
jgi:hypothetical protein